jgi:ribonuclease HII
VSLKAKKPKLPDSALNQPDPALNRLAYEHAAYQSGVFRVAGVDEAGRGPLAGPVVAAAVLFPYPDLKTAIPKELLALNDSKVLSSKKRGLLRPVIESFPGIRIGVGVVESPDIDRINILNATHQAMAKALQDLNADLALVDGLPVKGLPCPSQAIVKGDKLCFSISAASIIAKETRDDLMRELDETYPVYGFAKHKGYGTKRHLAALREHGPCPAHRRSFAPVRDVCDPKLPL